METHGEEFRNEVLTFIVIFSKLDSEDIFRVTNRRPIGCSCGVHSRHTGCCMRFVFFRKQGQ